MKLTAEQARRLVREIGSHASYSNYEAVNTQYQLLTLYNKFSTVDAINKMLEEGDPFLTELVTSMVYNRIKS